MIPWPFLFCQKPIVAAPVLACSCTMIGMLTDAVASGASFEDAVATLTTFPPAWNSASVTVCCPVHVIEAPTASVVAGQDGAASVLLSTRLIPVSVEVPVLATR